MFSMIGMVGSIGLAAGAAKWILHRYGIHVNMQGMKNNTETKMLTLQQIRDRLADRRLTVVADATGLSHQTLWRIAKGEANPTHDTLAKLSDYLEATCRL